MSEMASVGAQSLTHNAYKDPKYWMHTSTDGRSARWSTRDAQYDIMRRVLSRLGASTRK